MEEKNRVRGLSLTHSSALTDKHAGLRGSRGSLWERPAQLGCMPGTAGHPATRAVPPTQSYELGPSNCRPSKPGGVCYGYQSTVLPGMWSSGWPQRAGFQILNSAQDFLGTAHSLANTRERRADSPWGAGSTLGLRCEQLVAAQVHNALRSQIELWRALPAELCQAPQGHTSVACPARKDEAGLTTA